MSFKIKKAAVLGAGVMGAGIAAHLTNAGIECYLLDIIPFELTEDDKKKGLTEKSPAWRNRFAANGLAAVTKSKPASFFSKKNASMIKIGNFEDNLNWLADVDWICEVVVENLKIKQELFAKVEKVVKPTCIVSTNTSGIPIKDISAKFGPALKKRFLGTHFFNPPRYMKLMEIIPGEETEKEVVDYMVKFSEETLGKGVVICKDRPNFVGNRIGVFDLSDCIKIMLEKKMKIDEVDAIVGKALGHPGTAVFGTMDLVGLDVGYHVAKNLYDAVPDDEARDTFKAEPFLEKMIANKWLGNKSKQGYYKKTKDAAGKKVKLMLDIDTMEYVPAGKPKFDSISAAKKLENVADSIKLVFNADDKAGDFTRAYLCKTFIYSANRVGEICDDIMAIDNAMKWGYNNKLGPFEAWDAVGVKEAVEVMKKLKLKVPKKVEEMLKKGCESFYVTKADGKYYYDFEKKGYAKIDANPKIILLPDFKSRNKIVKENESASLIDIGDGVVCLEFHTKMNSIDEGLNQMLNDSCDIVEKDFEGMVVANHDERAFSAGANVFAVLVAAQKGEWDLLEKSIEALQNGNMKMKYLSKPVVTAPAGLALGGGCEIAMHGARCLPNGETYMGLVEVGVGVLPAGGGCKEILLRVTEGIPDGVVEAGLNLQYHMAKAFENIAMAKVATSAMEAMELGYIRKTEAINMNRDQQIYEAKQLVKSLVMAGYKPPRPALIPVMGENFRGLADAILMNMRYGNFISDFDLVVSRKVAYVLSGGDCAEGTFVSEQEILDLEREGFLSLMGETKTHERIMHMLTKGKPLRN
ncbi:MAG TPA: 3-hydroxyacyl-CoA dehydrogenase/enoyl-CoA hydratase family protein [Smithellaceae bacterium]|jgi:3-hydroxyacyl-CoA dehydrogenase|nr:3-hydroxyacyl-CoA dehydrogenase/enoyl-CoA hydratase family protein [Syntrophaceae bacterium]NMC90877.1 3-hydroxyacyl-CoA dehydrogenase/enoyl-CoA hydratase family protein [Smithella sp.]HNV57442.1 3-hydroxyacyl-CoA dehydrogenase/enoyl-CoA hydratase family protein [Smithellaceae bacterium]MBP8665575.1 3-hydroxyacyl-CoA dehydrogenase/enoyl-CoA hydratase family protein [Syntrophaceae bacterium]MBP9531355.1 3-hydroxyacyl-CoA dehydrogenase/enoyl-CoA hydratase family protein [Syntrophaceae bacteriu